MNIWKSTKAVADPGEAPPPPAYFQTKLRPEGPKINFGYRPPPPLRYLKVLIWRC